ncbi:MAG: hypothetical protein PUB32_07405 [Clostridiales bacterium]|nr:hypothetical protein [Clostridiales bacterium]
MKKCIIVLIVIILLFYLPACRETSLSSDEVWKFFKNTYGEYVYQNENGQMFWTVDAEEIKAQSADIYAYDGEYLKMCYSEVQKLPLLGNVLSYELYVDPGAVEYSEFLPLDASSEAKLYYPSLQVWLDGQWWPLKTVEPSGVNNGVWVQDGTTKFTFSMDASGTEKCLPDGKYRLVLSFEPGEVSVYDSRPQTAEQTGIVLAFEFEHSPDTVRVPETMADIYTDTWETMRNSYGDYFALDDNGNFIWNVGGLLPVYPEVDETLFIPYQGDDMRIEYCGVSEKDDRSPALEFQISNLTGRSVEIGSGPYQLHICLDGQWWNITSDYIMNISGTPHSLDDYGGTFWPIRVWRYSSGRLPEGTYRISCRLPKEVGGTVLMEEFELAY